MLPEAQRGLVVLVAEHEKRNHTLCNTKVFGSSIKVVKSLGSHMPVEMSGGGCMCDLLLL